MVNVDPTTSQIINQATAMAQVRTSSEVSTADRTHTRRILIGVTALQPAKSLFHVVAEAGLAQLAVVYAIDARLDLLFDVLADDPLQVFRESGFINRFAATLGHDSLPKVSRPRQGAGVHSKNPVCATDHLCLLHAVD